MTDGRFSQLTSNRYSQSARLMEDFLELAKDNIENDLETCGVLGAFLEKGTFYVTNLIIPKQESTSNSCQAINEKEIFAIQNEQSLFPVGWIHTHPSQSCFMSSIDLHTQYSYQVMVPEAFAIVVAPTDSSRSYGIFRVSNPSGMSVLKECQEKGSQFLSHKESVNESPIYEHCTHVYKNSNLRWVLCFISKLWLQSWCVNPTWLEKNNFSFGIIVELLDWSSALPRT
ncbi:hypothetical protein CRYUN_Cryun21dG0068300 [Craigia yunnanensis]